MQKIKGELELIQRNLLLFGDLSHDAAADNQDVNMKNMEMGKRYAYLHAAQMITAAIRRIEEQEKK